MADERDDIMAGSDEQAVEEGVADGQDQAAGVAGIGEQVGQAPGEAAQAIADAADDAAADGPDGQPEEAVPYATTLFPGQDATITGGFPGQAGQSSAPEAPTDAGESFAPPQGDTFGHAADGSAATEQPATPTAGAAPASGTSEAFSAAASPDATAVPSQAAQPAYPTQPAQSSDLKDAAADLGKAAGRLAQEARVSLGHAVQGAKSTFD